MPSCGRIACGRPSPQSPTGGRRMSSLTHRHIREASGAGKTSLNCPETTSLPGNVLDNLYGRCVNRLPHVVNDQHEQDDQRERDGIQHDIFDGMPFPSPSDDHRVVEGERVEHERRQ